MHQQFVADHVAVVVVDALEVVDVDQDRRVGRSAHREGFWSDDDGDWLMHNAGTLRDLRGWQKMLLVLVGDDATIRVTIPLPPGWSLQDDPTATSVTFRRGIPTTLNVPSLDDIFMYDGRNASLEEQALGAINSHYQPRRQPTAAELSPIDPPGSGTGRRRATPQVSARLAA